MQQCFTCECYNWWLYWESVESYWLWTWNFLVHSICIIQPEVVMSLPIAAHWYMYWLKIQLELLMRHVAPPSVLRSNYMHLIRDFVLPSGGNSMGSHRIVSTTFSWISMKQRKLHGFQAFMVRNPSFICSFYLGPPHKFGWYWKRSTSI